ncbi:MAG: hypothetical protein FWD90_04965 [Defluviitaleaceae bacterium]|nr:hypothetical protein [Defluviitaleaceae bacterium]
MKTNVLLFEDDNAVISVLPELIRSDGYNVLTESYDWKVVERWLDNKGAEDFVALVFDLKVPAHKMPVWGKQYDEKKDYSPSLYYIKHYINNKYPALMKKIILFSAYLALVPCDIKNNFILVDKNEGGANNKLRTYIKSLDN